MPSPANIVGVSGGGGGTNPRRGVEVRLDGTTFSDVLEVAVVVLEDLEPLAPVFASVLAGFAAIGASVLADFDAAGSAFLVGVAGAAALTGPTTGSFLAVFDTTVGGAFAGCC